MALTVYHDLGLAAWDCRIADLAAPAAWKALASGQRLLHRRSDGSWHGPLRLGVAPEVSLGEALRQAAARPWAAIRDEPGLPAWGLATSKGDPWAFTPAGCATAGPGHLGAAIARELAIGTYVPCAAAAACSTGLYSLLAVADRIADGSCSHGLAGAADGSLPAWLEAGFARLGVLCDTIEPSAFSGVDSGFAPAGGAGVIALVRGAAPWRLTAGVRLGDAGHETHFVDPATLTRALAGLWSAAPHPDLIITHATGTARGDAYEQAGLADGPWRDCPLLHLKPLIGHTLGASGTVELALGLEAPVRRIWKLSLGFGGHLAAVAVTRAETIQRPA